MKLNDHHIIIYLSSLLICICFSLSPLTAPIAWGQSSNSTGQQSPKKEKERIAVLELKNSAKLDKEAVSYLTALIRKAAARLPQSRFSLMTTENIIALLPPDTQLEDCLKECEVQTGRALGAHWMITGKILKFGGSLRIILNLHHTPSGELRGEPQTIKGGKIEDFETSLQAAAIDLFSTIDPSLKRRANRLRSGVVFELPQVPSLPALPTFQDEATRLSPSTGNAPKISLSAQKLSALNVDALEAYDAAVSIDQDQSIHPKQKLAAWKRVLAFKEMKETAAPLVNRWREIVEKQKQRELRLLAMIDRLEKVRKEDRKREVERKKRLDKDWGKVKRLLRLKNFEESQKLDWVEAFLEAYGVRRELNPYINTSDLAPYLKKLSDRIKSFQVESTSLIENQKQREQEINQRIYDLKSQTEKFQHLFKKEKNAHSALLRRFQKFKSLHMKRLSLRDVKKLKKDMQRHLNRYMNGSSERSAQLTEAITQIDTIIEVKEMMNKSQQAELDKRRKQQEKRARQKRAKTLKNKRLKEQRAKEKRAKKLARKRLEKSGATMMIPHYTIGSVNHAIGASLIGFRTGGHQFHFLSFDTDIMQELFDFRFSISIFRVFWSWFAWDQGHQHFGLSWSYGARLTLEENIDINSSEAEALMKVLFNPNLSKYVNSEVKRYPYKCALVYDFEISPLGFEYGYTLDSGTSISIAYELPIVTISEIDIFSASSSGGCDTDEDASDNIQDFSILNPRRSQLRFSIHW